MEGKELIQTICNHMGKEFTFQSELESLILNSGNTLEKINLEQLRELVANLLNEVILDRCNENNMAPISQK